MADIKKWSQIANNNSEASPNGWPENMARSGVNDSAREMMRAIIDFYRAAEWLDVYSTTGRAWLASRATDTSVILTAQDAQTDDIRSRFPVGSRIKLTGGATQYGFVTSTSYSSPNTTIDVVIDDAAVVDVLTDVLQIGVVRDLLEKTAYYPTGVTTGEFPPEVPTIDDLGDQVTLNGGHDPEGDGSPGIDADTVDGLHASDLITSSSAAGKNVVINGGFDVWQRGLTIDASTTDSRIYTNDHGNYTADRWKLLSGNGAGDTDDMVDVSRDITSPPDGFYAAMLCTSQLSFTTGDKFAVFQVMEARDSRALIDSSSVSMGVNLKGSGTLANARFMIVGYTGTADDPVIGTTDVVSDWGTVGDAPTLAANWSVLADSGQIVIEATWERYIMEDEDLSAVGSVKNIGILIIADSVFASAETFSIAGVRVENSSVAGNFQPSTYSEVLTKCQRWFLTSFEEDQDARRGAGIEQAMAGEVANAITEQSTIGWTFPVTMRIDPVSNHFNPDDNTEADAVWSQRQGNDYPVSDYTETITVKKWLLHGSGVNNGDNALLFVGLTLDAEF